MKRVLSVYWKYTKGIRTSAFLTLALFAVGMIFRDILRPYVVKDLVDGLTTHGDDKSYLWGKVLLFAGVHFVAQIGFRSAEFLNAVFESKHMRNLRNTAFAHMIQHSLSFFAGNYAGSLVTRQKRFVGSAEVLFDELSETTLGMIIQVVGICIILSFVSIPMVIGILIWVGFYITNSVIMGKKRLALDYKEAEEESKVTAEFADRVSNISVVKTFGTFKREKMRFYEVTTNHYKALRKTLKFSNTQNAIQGFLSAIIHITGISAALWLWINNRITTGNVILVIIYAGQLSTTLWGFGKTIRKYSRSIADAKEMVDIIDLPLTIVDAPNALTEVPPLLPNEATIDFKNVSFSYPKSEQIFKNFNLHIPAGQKVAIIGSTGAGKTTLISLLFRMVDPQEGSVHIGPYNIKTDVTQDAFKPCIGLVAQNIELFNQTIGENISYGKPDAQLDEIIHAAEKAHIHDFIIKQDKQYDTMVGERGVKLSGGQRQRIGIARALLHDAPILVFDEATSSLDNITEMEIQRILENGLREKTVIVIAHRLSTIRNCDRIIVMEQGDIVQDGNHEELITDTTGIYYQLLNSREIMNKEEVYS